MLKGNSNRNEKASLQPQQPFQDLSSRSWATLAQGSTLLFQAILTLNNKSSTFFVNVRAVVVGLDRIFTSSDWEQQFTSNCMNLAIERFKAYVCLQILESFFLLAKQQMTFSPV